MFLFSWARRASRLLAGIGAAACLALPAHATQIALFNNGSYVDIDNEGDVCESEVENLLASIDSFGGHSVATFSGIAAADFTAALAGKQVLIIPELEEGDLAPDLSPEALAAIADFVSQGGRLLVFGDSNPEVEALLNAVFGFSLSVDGSPTQADKTPQAAGTIFENGTATIPYNNGTGYIQVSSLPAEAINVYNYNDGSEDFSVLTILPFGSGEIIFFGWDWYGSMPPGGPGDNCEDGLDGGWQELLALALTGFEADLQISKVADAASVEEGDEVTFTITVTNNGPADATEVVVTDTLPVSATLVSATASQGGCVGTSPVTCDLGDLADGATATVTLVVTADAEGTLTNQAEVSAANDDPDPANNTATASVTVTLTPSLISGAGCGLGAGPVSGASLSGAWVLALAAWGALRGFRARR